MNPVNGVTWYKATIIFIFKCFPLFLRKNESETMKIICFPHCFQNYTKHKESNRLFSCFHFQTGIRWKCSRQNITFNSAKQPSNSLRTKSENLFCLHGHIVFPRKFFRFPVESSFHPPSKILFLYSLDLNPKIFFQ